MSKLIAPSGSICEVPDKLVTKLTRKGWKRPLSAAVEPDEHDDLEPLTVGETDSAASGDAEPESTDADPSADDSEGNAEDQQSDPGTVPEDDTDAEDDDDEESVSDGGDGAQGIDFTKAKPQPKRRK